MAPVPVLSQVTLVVNAGDIRDTGLIPGSGDIRDTDSIPGSGRSRVEGHGNPLQYSCLENPMDRGTMRATVHSVTKSDKTGATYYAACMCVTKASPFS